MLSIQSQLHKANLISRKPTTVPKLSFNKFLPLKAEIDLDYIKIDNIPRYTVSEYVEMSLKHTFYKSWRKIVGKLFRYLLRFYTTKITWSMMITHHHQKPVMVNIDVIYALYNILMNHWLAYMNFERHSSLTSRWVPFNNFFFEDKFSDFSLLRTAGLDVMYLSVPSATHQISDFITRND